MTTLLLVHGGWSASWAWDRLTPELERRGIASRCIDLPGHGTRHRNPWSVSLADYGDAISAEARSIDGPVVAVGHSMGGFCISQAAGRDPDAFTALVYLAAFLPKNGERLIRLGGRDRESQLGPAIKLDPLRGRILLDTEKADPALFHDCEPSDREAGLAAIGPNPMRPGLARIRLDERFDRVPKHTIFCTRDRAITPDHQRWMAERYDIESSHELESGHMPAYVAPSELAEVLQKIVGSIDAGRTT